MARRENFSWEATFYIWWSATWRTVLGFGAAEVVENSLLPMVPGFTNLIEQYQGLYQLLGALVSWWIMLWAIKSSLMDRYIGFSFFAESKATRQSIFSASRNLGLNVVLPVWWAQTWRNALVPLALFVGTIAAALVSHQDVIKAIWALDQPPARHFTLCIWLAVSIWSTRESLSDRYRSFRFATRPKVLPT